MKDKKSIIIGLIIGIIIVVFGTTFSYKYCERNFGQFLIVNIPITITLDDSYYEHIHQDVCNYGVFLTTKHTQYTVRESSDPFPGEAKMITLYPGLHPVIYLSIVNIIIDILIVVLSVVISVLMYKKKAKKIVNNNIQETINRIPSVISISENKEDNEDE